MKLRLTRLGFGETCRRYTVNRKVPSDYIFHSKIRSFVNAWKSNRWRSVYRILRPVRGAYLFLIFISNFSEIVCFVETRSRAKFVVLISFVRERRFVERPTFLSD